MEWLILVPIGLIVFLAPFAELERRINELRRARFMRERKALVELSKPNPVWTHVPPESRLRVMSRVLMEAGEEEMARETDAFIRKYRKPTWMTWAILPIALFNVACLAGVIWIMVTASFWGGFGLAWFLAIVNFASYFDTGAHQIADENYEYAQNWLPSPPPMWVDADSKTVPVIVREAANLKLSSVE